MTKETIDIVANACINAINELNIPTYDKMELMLNIFHFLDYDQYEDNINLLNNKVYRKKR